MNFNCMLGNYLLCCMLTFSNVFTVYYIYPFLVWFLPYYSHNFIPENSAVLMGVYVGLIIGLYDICRVLSSCLWRRVSKYLGLSLSINISLVLLAGLNFYFSYVNTVLQLILLRVLSGAANNLPLFSKNLLLEIFPLKEHSKMIQIFALLQNIAAAFILFISGILNLDYLHYTTENENENENDNLVFNKHALISLLLSIVNLLTLVIFVIKFRCKYFLPNKRNEYYMQDFNIGITERHVASPMANQDPKNISQSHQKLKNPNKEDIVEVVNLDLFSSNNKSQAKQEEFMTKRNEDSLNRNINNRGNIRVEGKIHKLSSNLKKLSSEQTDTEISNSFQKIEMVGGKKEDETGNSLNIKKMKDIDGVNNPNISNQLDAKNEEKKLNSMSNSTGKKSNKNVKEKLSGKQKEKCLNYMDPKNIQIIMNRRNTSSRLSEDVVNRNHHDKLRMIRTSSSPKHTRTESIVSPFMISLIFTCLQVCDTLSFTVYFLKLFFSSDNRGLELNQFTVCWIMSLYYLICTVILPITNSLVTKVGLNAPGKNTCMYHLFLVLGLVLTFVFNLFENLFHQDFLLALYLLGILFLRNLCLYSTLTCYNLVIIRLHDIYAKDQITNHQAFSSVLIRDVFTIFGCFLYSYSTWISISLVLYFIPSCLLLTTIWLGKKYLFILS